MGHNVPTADEVQAYRRAHFAVKVERLDRHSEPGEIRLMTTRNGLAWTSMTLTPLERLAVIRALLLYDDFQDSG